MNSRFHDQLIRQLAFLGRSCAAYDAGHVDEALRIAVVIRTLIHQTRSSTSLLTHLGAGSVELLSTAMDIVARFSRDDSYYKGASHVFFNGMGRYKIGPGAAYVPKLGDSYTKEFKSVQSWWAQPVIILDRISITRRDIVLTAANKDGGAHVDAELTPEYEQLISPGSVGTFMVDASTEPERPITDAHLVALRQMGFELMNSPQLLAFVQPAT